MAISDRIPGEYFPRAVKRRERWTERALELGVELLRRPAIRTVDRADRPGLVEQEHLVVAHREDLPGDAGRLVGAEIDHQRRDLLRCHLLQPRDALLLSVGLGRDRADHAAPGKRRNRV